MLALPFLIAVTLSLRVKALNDWNVPCTDGKCSYDWDSGDPEKAFSSLAVDGSRQLLSDITQAAGWKVWKCNPEWADGDHDVLMVCDGTPEQVALCNHVYENGAENMVVRLPNNCAKGPFARVKSTFEPANETIPDNIKSQMQRDPSTVAVRGLKLDYDFKSIPDSKGKLNFAITSSNAAHPVISRRHNDFYKRGRARYIERRGLFDKIKDTFSDATSAIASVATQGASAVADGATKGASAVASVATEGASAVKDGATKGASAAASVATQAASKAADAGKAVATAAVKGVDAAKNATSFNKTETNGNVPLKLNQNFTLLDTDIQCSSFKNDISAHVTLDMDVQMDANVKYGYHLEGSLVPFDLKDMSVFATLTGGANTTFGLALEATGQLDTFPIELFKFGLPGLSIPGVAALGPELIFETRLKMDLDIAAQMDIQANFDFGDVSMTFPEDKGKSQASSKPGKAKNSLKMSTANGGTDFSGTVEALLIPSFNFGVDLKVAQASVFLEMEVGAELEMAGTAGIGGPKEEAGAEDGTEDGTEDAAEDGTEDGTEDAAEDGTEDADADGTEDAAADDAAADDADNAAAEDDTDAADDDTAATEDDTAAEDDAELTRRADDEEGAAVDNEVAGDDVPTVSAPPNGCLRLNAVMSINYGFRGSIVPLFPQSVKIPLFNTTKELLTKCFNNATADILEKAEEAGAEDDATAEGGEEDTATEDDAATEDDTAATEDDTAEDDTATDADATDDAATEDDAAASDVTARSIVSRRRLARRESLADIAAAVVPQLASTAINLLVCPKGFIPVGAFSSII